jgi:hypothetical protein
VAFTSVTEVGTAESAGTAGTTLTITLSAGVAAGHAVIVCGGGFQPVSSVSDSRGNTYAVAGTASDGSKCGSIAYCASVATALSAGDTITITWASSATNGCGSAFDVAYTGTFSFDAGATGATSGTGNASVTTGSTGTLADPNDLYFMALGRDGASTVTLTHTTTGLTDGTKVSTSAGTARSLHTAYKILSGDTSSQTYAGTLSAARSWGCVLSLFRAVDASSDLPRGRAVALQAVARASRW